MTDTPLASQLPAVNTDLPTVQFGAYDKADDANTQTLPAYTWTMKIPSAQAGTIICVGLSIIFGIYSIYLTESAKVSPDPLYTSIVETIREWVWSADDTIGYPGINQTLNATPGVMDTGSINAVIDAAIPYIYKKDILAQRVQGMGPIIAGNKSTLTRTQKDIATYGYLHPDVVVLLDAEAKSIPIITSLATLQTIKFATALQMFSHLSTFVSNASDLLNLPAKTIRDELTTIVGKGDVYVSRYLTNCYLNPFENLNTCDEFNDIKNYFLYDTKETNVNLIFLVDIINLVEQKLDNTQVPSLVMQFDRYTPGAKSLSFSVTINTFVEDERAFLEEGILSPHIFIMSTLMDMLKQSLYIVGEDIAIDRLNIQKRSITIGETEVPINTSTMSFALPLQQSSQREITDFYSVQ